MEKYILESVLNSSVEVLLSKLKQVYFSCVINM